MDYTALGNRAANAKENIEKDRAPMEDGEYKCVLRKGEFGKSRSGNDMFTLTMKVTDKDASERMAGETLLIRFAITPNTEHQLDHFLNVMVDWGCDISTIKKDDDWEDLFIDLIAARPKAVVEVVRDTKNPKYYNFNWIEVVRALNLDELEGLDKPKEAKPKAEPKKKAAAKPKAEPKPEPTPEPEVVEEDPEW